MTELATKAKCTFPIGRPVNTAHPPVKVLFTDGFNQGVVCPVEQVLQIDGFPSIPHHHLLLLPEDTHSRNMNVMT